ncbi:MAG: TetR/AcrR family transcriptional regulator [Coriobacteriales bacterium]|jgi:AcrR family transcriptional regulator|nr:TetR/AcrR family transcriptional regulator [Coriobacteriales bacterium]
MRTSSSTKETIENSFVELFMSLSYSSISVALICKAAHVSRTTFYDSFSGKEAVLTKIVEDDIVKPLLSISNNMDMGTIKSAPTLLMELIYKNIQHKADFYLRLNRLDNGALLQKILTSGFMTLNNEILEKSSISEDEKRYAGFFFASSNATLVGHWLSNSLDVTPETLARFYNKWTMHYWLETYPGKLDWTTNTKGVVVSVAEKLRC